MVQWLGLRASTAGGSGSIPGRGTKSPEATWYGQKKKRINFFSHSSYVNSYFFLY